MGTRGGVDGDDDGAAEVVGLGRVLLLEQGHGGRQGRQTLTQCVKDLSAHAVDVAVVSDTALSDLSALAAASPTGTGRLLLAPDAGAAIYEARRRGPRLLWDRHHQQRGAPHDAQHVTTDAVDWLLGDLWRRGIGPGLILMIGDVPRSGRPLALGVTRADADGPALVDHLAAQVARAVAGRVPTVDETPGWCLVLEGDQPQRRRVDETLLTVADGRITYRA